MRTLLLLPVAGLVLRPIYGQETTTSSTNSRSISTATSTGPTTSASAWTGGGPPPGFGPPPGWTPPAGFRSFLSSIAENRTTTTEIVVSGTLSTSVSHAVDATTSAHSSTPTSNTTLSDNSLSTSNSPSSNDAAVGAGVGVGVGLGVVLIGAAAFAFWFFRRRRRSAQHAGDKEVGPDGGRMAGGDSFDNSSSSEGAAFLSGGTSPRHYGPASAPSEMATLANVSQLSGDAARYEAHGDGLQIHEMDASEKEKEAWMVGHQRPRLTELPTGDPPR